MTSQDPERQMLREEIHEVKERLGCIERDIAAMKATRGQMQLNASALSLIWAVLVSAAIAVAFVIRVDTKVGIFTQQAAYDRVVLMDHIGAPGHQVSMEKISQISKKVETMETGANKGNGK